MKSFDYYLFYNNKDDYFYLTDSFKNIIHATISFRGMYIFIRKNKISFDNIKLKSMLLSDFFRHYVTFDDTKGSDIL